MPSIDVFMDSAGFFALWDAGDGHHAAAVKLQRRLADEGRRFLATDYVVDETATLLLVRHSHEAARDFLETIEKSVALRLEWIGPDRFRTASELFCRRGGKIWSFTDCTSFVLMNELRIQDAFTTDRHFRQAGFVPLLEGRP